MMRMVQVNRSLTAIEQTLAVGLLAMLILVSAFNIMSRNLMGRSYGWLQTAEPTLVLWIALVGATLALGQQRHIRLETLVRFWQPVWQMRARMTAAAAGTLVMGLLTVTAAQFAASEIELFGPSGWLAAPLPLFFLVCSARYLLLTISPDKLK
jgi:TRAP-type C4-dicarboxylate transport system permease small subunit